MREMDITDILRGKSSKDCQCCAYGACECACDVTWPEQVAVEAADEIDRLRAELAEAVESRNDNATALAIKTIELAEARRLLDEARKQEPVATLVWSDGGDDVVFEEFAHTFNGMKLYAAPVPAQPAVPDDVAKDAARYRFLRSDGRCDVYVFEHYLSRKELDAAIDAAIISATEGRSNG